MIAALFGRMWDSNGAFRSTLMAASKCDPRACARQRLTDYSGDAYQSGSSSTTSADLGTAIQMSKRRSSPTILAWTSS